MWSRVKAYRRRKRAAEREQRRTETMGAIAEFLALPVGVSPLDKLHPSGAPNLAPLHIALRNTAATNLNLKFFGYSMARQLSAALPPRTGTVARHVGLALPQVVRGDEHREVHEEIDRRGDRHEDPVGVRDGRGEREEKGQRRGQDPLRNEDVHLHAGVVRPLEPARLKLPLRSRLPSFNMSIDPPGVCWPCFHPRSNDARTRCASRSVWRWGWRR